MDSSRQIIYVEIDEEITSIFERIKNIRKREILLVVPRKAILFQSVVNLKILKTKLQEKKKKLIIVTSDSNGKHLAEKVGIQVLKRVEVEESLAPTDDSHQVRIQPIQARRNIIDQEEAPKRFTEKKVSIRDLLQEFRKKHQSGKRAEEDAANSFSFSKPSRKFLALIILVSIGLFALISYIALPSATIYIRPKFDNIDHTVNITLADKRKNQNLLQKNALHVIASEEVKTITKQTKVFNTASKEFKGENATGSMKIINTSDEEWNLKELTRFQTENGIVFHIIEGAFIPPRAENEAGELIPGELAVLIEADNFDTYGEPIGERGNIPPSRLTIPGLTKYNQRIIWGETEKTLTGGVTDFLEVVKNEDIEAAKKQIEDNLIMTAKEELLTYIEEVNKLNQTNLVLLDDSRYLITELLDLRISDDLEGSYKKKFEIFAKIEAQGVAFDFDQLFVLLKKELATRTHPNMRLRDDSISPENIVYEVIDEDPDLGQIKITATIVGIEEFVIEATTEAGIRFVRKVQERVLGLTIEEAENFVGNFSEVDEVEIKTWPVWINKLPRVPESIEIKLMD